MTQQEDNLKGPIRVMVVASFIMLSMLTWAASPLQKLVEKVQHKETIKAKMKVCSHVRSMQHVYEDYVQKMFVSGCMWQTRNILYFSTDDKKERESIDKLFEEQDSERFEHINNDCLGGGAKYQEQGKIKELLVSNIYFTEMKCPEVFEEGEKLGIKEDDVQQ